jgi:hypothetical protein
MLTRLARQGMCKGMMSLQDPAMRIAILENAVPKWKGKKGSVCCGVSAREFEHW